jgi:uncharacterized protein
LLIEVGDLRRETGREKEFTGRVSRLEIALQGESFAFSDVAVDGWAKNVGGKIYIKGSIGATVHLTCGRCLVLFDMPVTTSFEETYYAAGTIDESTLDGTGRIYHGEQIDIGEMIIESLILTLPMKSVCSQDCRGLCPVCGCNRNQEQCGCNSQAPDPRLAALGELLKNMED